MSAWAVPIECIRHGATFEGALILGDLASQYAQYQGSATVELGPNGFVATLIYTLPGHPSRTHCAHVGLAWAAIENRYRPPVAVPVPRPAGTSSQQGPTP